MTTTADEITKLRKKIVSLRQELETFYKRDPECYATPWQSNVLTLLLQQVSQICPGDEILGSFSVSDKKGVCLEDGMVLLSLMDATLESKT